MGVALRDGSWLREAYCDSQKHASVKSISLAASVALLLVMAACGPLFVDEEYEVEREVVALSGSRRTESAWIKTRVFDKANTMVATMLLNMATIKDSYAPYEKEYRKLYGARRQALD
jgi:hypothetical protein